MTVSIIAKNTAQGISKGTTVSSGTITVLIGATVIHTVPAGRRQKIHCIYTIRTITALQRVRIRIAGALIDEVGTGAPVAPPSVTRDLGTYTMNAGEEYTANSGDLPSEGATILATIAILEDLPS